MIKKRLIRKEERALVEYMLRNNDNFILPKICYVVDMNDGGMGSVYFYNNKIDYEKRALGKVINEGEFIDEDGMLIEVTLLSDSDNALYELDIWRIDYNPIKKYPLPPESSGLWKSLKNENV